MPISSPRPGQGAAADAHEYRRRRTGPSGRPSAAGKPYMTAVPCRARVAAVADAQAGSQVVGEQVAHAKLRHRRRVTMHEVGRGGSARDRSICCSSSSTMRATSSSLTARGRSPLPAGPLPALRGRNSCSGLFVQVLFDVGEAFGQVVVSTAAASSAAALCGRAALLPAASDVPLEMGSLIRS